LKFYVAWWLFFAGNVGLSFYYGSTTDYHQSPVEVLASAFTLMLGIVSFPFTLIPLIRRKDDFITWLFRAILLPICYGMLGVLIIVLLLFAVEFFLLR
jgi:hypothetical protein